MRNDTVYNPGEHFCILVVVGIGFFQCSCYKTIFCICNSLFAVFVDRFAQTFDFLFLDP